MKLNRILLLGIFAIITSFKGENKKPIEIKLQQPVHALAGDTISEIDGSIRCIFQDSKNNYWFTTDGQGILKYDGKNISRFTTKHGLCNDFVWNVWESADGKIWLKTRDAICYFDGMTFTTVKPEDNALQDKNSNYTNDLLLVDHYYTGKLLVKIPLPHTSPINPTTDFHFEYDIFATCKDRKGNIWLGTCNKGVCVYDGKNYTWINNKELKPAVRAIFEDKNGVIWIGNNGEGLFKYENGILVNFSKEKKLHNYDLEKYPLGKEGMMSRVWTITDDAQGNLWIGTIDNGVWKSDGKTVTNYTTKNGLLIDAIWTIYKDKKGELWFGTDGDGVYKFNGTLFEKFKL